MWTNGEDEGVCIALHQPLAPCQYVQMQWPSSDEAGESRKRMYSSDLRGGHG